jgi:dipeptidyl aminopeptidase/acylaminoacyl peptidase
MRRLSLILLLALPLFAQSSTDADVLKELYSVKRIEHVAISPDATRVTWAVAGDGVYVAKSDGAGAHRVLTGAAADEADGDWSPDSKSLAFLSDAGSKGQRQVYIDANAVTKLQGFLSEPKWSPDGKSIAFLFIEHAGRAAGPLVAMSRAIGVIDEELEEQRVAVLDVATKNVRLVTPDNLYVYHFDWSPDSKRLVAEAAPGSGDQNYWIASLHIVDVASGSTHSIYKPRLQIAEPHWADEHHIAFIEGLMSDEGSNGGDVMIVDDDGKNARNTTPGMKATATAIFQSRIPTFLATENGHAAVMQVEEVQGWAWLHTAKQIWRGDEAIELSLSHCCSTTAAIRNSFSHAPEIWVGKIGEWKQITHLNDNVHASWGEARSVEWKNDDFTVQGWLLFPSNYDAAKKYPMIVTIHGGPASAFLSRWPREETAMLARHGYFVFMPNPRGSYGGGETFTEANVKDFGYGDLRDVLAGIDAVEKQFPIDDHRIGLWGWSYGGYMTMFAVTQTNRFHAAVAGAGIANWQSYYGENDITQWMIPYFGASVYDDPAVYAKSSPITFIKNVKTPTLVVVGERDGECPAPQSFEFWRALKTNGVETQLVVYPDEGHRFMQPEHKRDLVRRVIGWFDGHLR